MTRKTDKPDARIFDQQKTRKIAISTNNIKQKNPTLAKIQALADTV